MKPIKVVENSDNRKTGLVSATYAPIQSCPDVCPFKDGGCYGQQSFCGKYFREVSKAAEKLKITQPRQIAREEGKAIKTLSGKHPLRLHTAGDCRSEAAVKEIVKATKDYPNRVWTYTHAWRNIDSDTWEHISTLASCENITQAKEAYSLGYAPSMVCKEHFEGVIEKDGLYFMVCPFETKGMQCVKCKMCMNADRLYRAGIIICFPAHGSQLNITKSKVEDLG